jgi:transaldolase/glucose-6-phosphate isomerase
MEGDDDSLVKQAEGELKREGVPLVSIAVHTPAELGAGAFKWEVATALTCAQLNINPFDEPDTQLGGERFAEIVEGLASSGERP